ncbi:MAG TPA: formyl transferase [Caldimonas sp.]|nr:formyl transferase [Caldimonas sp.]
MSELSIMILCGRSPRHLYVANRLCEAARPLAIVHETGISPSARTILRNLRPDNFARKLWRKVRDTRRYAGGKEARFFFGSAVPALARADLLTTVTHINHPDVVALADRLKPDVIAVFGTSLIRGPLLTRGRLGMLNLHGGLSPEYRGADCTFWTLYNGEPDKVGCTLHFIDPGIDTGRLVAHVCPPVTAADDELTLFWGGVKLGADVYAEALDRLARGEALGVAQSSKGRLYQVKQRGWRQERRLAARLRDGLLRDVALPARVRWFVREANDATVRAETSITSG